MVVTKVGTTRLSARRSPSVRAFTLLELLIAIAIIGVLVALIGAGAGWAWDMSTDVQCKRNLSQLHQAFHMGRDLELPRNSDSQNWLGFIESDLVNCGEVLICSKGDTGKLDPTAPQPVNHYPEVADFDTTPLPPPPPGDAISSQDLEPMRPPASVMRGATESNTVIREFQERKSFVLPSSIKTDISGPGYYDSYAKMTGGSVSGGTRVNCYFLHFDPVGSQNSITSGRMNFNSDILGIICRDAQLDASDPVLGNPGTQYPTGLKSRGFESGAEIVSVSPDRRTLTINRFQTSSVLEQTRVIVSAQAPAATGGGGGGGGGSVGSGSSVALDEELEYGLGGGPTSYAMNKLATSTDAWPGQVLLVECYDKAILELILDGSSAKEFLLVHLAPRHSGLVNTLFVDGHVEGLTPEELTPSAAGQPWIGSHGNTTTP